jgi:hypothetical protein
MSATHPRDHQSFHPKKSVNRWWFELLGYVLFALPVIASVIVEWNSHEHTWAARAQQARLSDSEDDAQLQSQAQRIREHRANEAWWLGNDHCHHGKFENLESWYRPLSPSCQINCN